jgi:hypothetical protein
MPSIPFADNFLAGSIISLLLPVGLLIALTVWYWLAVRRFPEDSDAKIDQPRPGPAQAEEGAALAAEPPPADPSGSGP